MLYSELKDTNVNIFNNITVISGYPGTGKSTAKKMLHCDACFSLYDLDSGDFKKNPGVNNENWAQLYVGMIAASITNLTVRRSISGEENKTTYVLMVSSHLEVRKLLNERGIPFIYVKPADKDMADYLTTFVIEPREDSKKEGDKRAVAFTKKTVEAYSRGEYPQEPELQNQFVIELDTADGPEGKVYYHMTDVIYTITQIPFDYRNENVFRLSTIRDMQEMLSLRIDKWLSKTEHGDMSDIAKLGVSSRGEVYAVFRRKGVKAMTQFLDNSLIPREISDKVANQGTDRVLLHRRDAEAIIRMLNSAITRLESGTRTDNDIEVFGDDAISYERLIDELDHTCLPISIAKNGDNTEQTSAE